MDVYFFYLDQAVGVYKDEGEWDLSMVLSYSRIAVASMQGRRAHGAVIGWQCAVSQA